MGKIEIIGQQPEEKIKDFHCPECKTPRPPFSFEMNGGDLGIMGMVQYLIVFCGAKLPAIPPICTRCGGTGNSPVATNLTCSMCGGTGKNPNAREERECGCILSTEVVFWQPPQDPAMIKALQDFLRKATFKQ